MGSTPFFLRCEYSIRIENASNDDGRNFHCYCYQTAQTSVDILPFEAFSKSAQKVFSLLQDMCVSSVDLEVIIKSKLYLEGQEAKEISYHLSTKEVDGKIGTVFVIEEKGQILKSHISVITCIAMATEKLFEEFSDMELEQDCSLLEISLESSATGIRPKF